MNYVYLISDETGAVAAFTRKWMVGVYLRGRREALPYETKLKVERFRSSIFRTGPETVVDITDEMVS